MPFGICSASEIFQRRMHEIIEGLTGVEVVVDDFLIYGCGVNLNEANRDHYMKLRLFIEICRDNDLHLKSDKIRFKEK